jgi:hypothetical protein
MNQDRIYTHERAPANSHKPCYFPGHIKINAVGQDLACKPAITAKKPIKTLTAQSIRCLLDLAAFIPIASLGLRRS